MHALTRPRVVPVEAVALFLILLLGPAQRAVGHATDCAHTHNLPFPNSVITCDAPGAICDVTGVCTDANTTNRSWCECVKPAPKRGCASSGDSTFGSLPSGLPGDGALVTYTTVVDPLDFWSLVRTEDLTVIQEFGSSPGFLSGSVTLRYGSFLPDPAHVPVEIVSMSLVSQSVLIDATPSGPNTFHLPLAGPTQYLVYDSTLGQLDTVDASGIALEMDGALVQGLPVKVNLSAQVTPSGALLFGQGITYFPEALPAVSRGGLWVLGLLLASAALLVLRTGVWRRA